MGFTNEQVVADLLKWYGNKDKAMEAIMQSTGNPEENKQEQDENVKIYKQFLAAKEAGNMNMAHSAVEMLAENYKTMFALDNARNILLDLAKEYLQSEKLAEENPTSDWVILNGNRIQIKRKQFEKVIDTLDAI